jgi:hypothetical protein
MSNRYKGAVISATPPTTTGGEEGTASGAWTLEQQMQLQAAGLWPAQPTGPFIEQVFSTYLYTGNGSTQAINNGINLSGKGGLVWIKNRNSTQNHYLITSPDSTGYELSSNDTGAGGSLSGSSWLFTNTGFSFDAPGFPPIGTNGNTYASWTFRKQPKFFDIVTFTGDGVAGRTVAHNLGSVPGCIMVKRTDTTGNWLVYHRQLNSGVTPQNYYQVLDLAQADAANSVMWNNTAPTSTDFTVGAYSGVNASGGTYVAYIFAHNAGGFGLTGTDNVISCGSFTKTASWPDSAPVVLGYEPQFLLFKRIDSGTTENWNIGDVIRGASNTTGVGLSPNLSSAETSTLQYTPLATGFTIGNSTSIGGTYIYIAIRRGPMRVPTVGTSVFAPVTRTGTGTTATVTTGNLPDWVLIRKTAGSDGNNYSRLTGPNSQLYTNLTLQEINQGATYGVTSFLNTAFTLGLNANGENQNGVSLVNYAFSRAPSFFDEVCYTGNSATPRTITHNLGVAPELMLIKSRSNARGWAVYASAIGNNKYLILNSTNAALTDTTIWVNTAPTSSVFTVGDPFDVNNTAYTYVAYLFATCTGVSKVGTYTGTGATQTVNCGFTSGARWVMIKRTDSTGDWYVWDTARGMVSGTDPSWFLNTGGAEVNADSVYTITTGFQIVSTAAGINASGGTYIFLAIA